MGRRKNHDIKKGQLGKTSGSLTPQGLVSMLGRKTSQPSSNYFLWVIKLVCGLTLSYWELRHWKHNFPEMHVSFRLACGVSEWRKKSVSFILHVVVDDRFHILGYHAVQKRFFNVSGAYRRSSYAQSNVLSFFMGNSIIEPADASKFFRWS